MSIAESSGLLGSRKFQAGYELEFIKNGEAVVAKLYNNSSPIGECILQDLSVQHWTYESLPDFAREALDQFLTSKNVPLEPERVSLTPPAELSSRVSAVSTGASSEALHPLELDFVSKKIEAQTLLEEERLQGKAIKRLTKIEAAYKKINTLISFYNKGNISYKGAITANINSITNNLLPRPDNWKVISTTEKLALNALFDPVREDCLNLQTLLNPPSPEELKRLAAIRARNIQLEAHLREEQELLNSNPLFEEYLKHLKKTIKKEAVQPNGVYFADAWPSPGSESAEGWIQNPFLTTLKKHLEQAGIETVKMDIVSNRIGRNIQEYMTQIQTDDYVVLFGSPSLKEKHDRGTPNVCVELIEILRKREQDLRQGLYRIFPILLSGDMRESFPPEYERYTTVSDWRIRGYFANFQKLYLELFNLAPEHFLEKIKPSVELQQLLAGIQSSRARP